MPDLPQPPAWVRDALREGLVIPAHPLALDDDGKFDERHQRALTRYYAAAGAGGVAVAVHTTQFAIRDPSVKLLEPVLRCAKETLDALESAGGPRLVRVAGVCGHTPIAMREAELAAGLGYHAGLLNLGALREADDRQLIEHCARVAQAIPLFGFYLNPAVGGRPLSADFWRRFAQVPNVVAIKVAPFDRYQTLDVVRAVAEAGRAGEVALYTGNDDHIVGDLAMRFDMTVAGKTVSQRIVGGLLGHWAVWTNRAVALFDRLRALRKSDAAVPPDVLALDAQVTDCNAALFDAANGFRGVIPGVQHVLYGQGLVASPRCLDPNERLSVGQEQQLARVRAAYPHLIDDDFVAEHLDEWLA
jgi:dihydrodipicolinate synthase/N-acetylneuraminate lyase